MPNANDNWSLQWSITLFIFLVTFIVFNLVQRKRNKYAAYPNVTLKAHMINFMLWPFKTFRLSDEFKPLDLDELKREAIQKVGYDDFGDDYYESLFRYTISLLNSSSYSPIGHIAAREFFKRKLITKLRIIHETKLPSVRNYIRSNAAIREPIFVVGMPRTGTTFLHRLLSLDPDARAPLTWELFDPTPRIRDDALKDETKRVEFCQKGIEFLLSFIPQLADVHEMGAKSPEECMVSMSMDVPFLFETFHVLIDNTEIPYTWKGTSAYRNYEKVLLILQEQAERRGGSHKRWVLKSPPHIGGLSFLSEVFKDARIVWTHRDLKEVLPSFASLIRVGQDLCEGSGTIHLDKLGRNCLDYAKEMIRRGDVFFSSTTPPASNHSRSNVLYTDLIANPIQTIRDLYKTFGYEFTKEYQCILERYIEENKKHRELHVKNRGRKKIHVYSLEEYGLTEEDIEESLGWYEKKYLGKK